MDTTPAHPTQRLARLLYYFNVPSFMMRIGILCGSILLPLYLTACVVAAILPGFLGMRQHEGVVFKWPGLEAATRKWKLAAFLSLADVAVIITAMTYFPGDEGMLIFLGILLTLSVSIVAGSVAGFRISRRYMRANASQSGLS